MVIGSMGVPESIRKVPRPEGTIVFAYGKNKNLFGVKKRNFEKENGKVVQKDGPTIGHILDGKYVPVDSRPKIRYDDSDILRWGSAQLIVNVTKDIFSDLAKVYNGEDAEKIYVMAILRTVENQLKDDEMKSAYENSFVSQIFPGISLSKDSVGSFLYDLGRTCSHIYDFMKLRTSRVPCNHSVVVDGTLKSYESEKNAFSEYSRKARKKGVKDISLIYAFDVDEMEPICNSVYQGNVLDVSAFRDFLESTNITKGLIVTDKGFTYNAARNVFLDNPDLHFLIPLKRGCKAIDEYLSYSFDSSLSNRIGIECKKTKMKDGRFLYSFKDLEMAKNEEEIWIQKNKNYDSGELSSARAEFGTIVFVSDLDAPPESIYAAYEDRWEIESFFRFYKNILELDDVRVHSEQSVIGTEFVNLLSSMMMCRIKKAFDSVKELSCRPFRKNMKLLDKGIMVRRDGSAEWNLKKISKWEEEMFIDLGLIKSEQKVQKKRGRPKSA